MTHTNSTDPKTVDRDGEPEQTIEGIRTYILWQLVHVLRGFKVEMTPLRSTAVDARADMMGAEIGKRIAALYTPEQPEAIAQRINTDNNHVLPPDWSEAESRIFGKPVQPKGDVQTVPTPAQPDLSNVGASQTLPTGVTPEQPEGQQPSAGVHLTHCYMNDTEGCAYGDPLCPARPATTFVQPAVDDEVESVFRWLFVDKNLVTESRIKTAVAEIAHIREMDREAARLEVAEWYTTTATAMFDELYDGKKASAELYMTNMSERLTEYELRNARLTNTEKDT